MGMMDDMLMTVVKNVDRLDEQLQSMDTDAIKREFKEHEKAVNSRLDRLDDRIDETRETVSELRGSVEALLRQMNSANINVTAVGTSNQSGDNASVTGDVNT